MLQDLKKRVEYLKENSCFMPLRTLGIYDGVFDFGEDMKGAAAHFSTELEKAVRLMHSQKKYDQACGLDSVKEIIKALSLLVKDTDPWAYVDDLQPGEKFDGV